MKVPGVLDLGCGNMYLPCGRRFADRQLYQDALSWMHTRMSALPVRCSPIVFTDANARLGSVPLENHHQQVLIGQVRPHNEIANSYHFCVFFWQLPTYWRLPLFGNLLPAPRGARDILFLAELTIFFYHPTEVFPYTNVSLAIAMHQHFSSHPHCIGVTMLLFVALPISVHGMKIFIHLLAVLRVKKCRFLKTVLIYKLNLLIWLLPNACCIKNILLVPALMPTLMSCGVLPTPLFSML